MSSQMVRDLEARLTRLAPYMASTVEKARSRFGAAWEASFEETLGRLFRGEPERLENAVRGYVRFALDAIKLQKVFEKERVYRAKSYAEVGQEVYHNRDYMETLYLPGILLSHYLWPHHYNQLMYFQKRFAPLVRATAARRFCDIGIGTGFYSRQMLSLDPGLEGDAFDISEHSMSYARQQIKRFDFASRWRGHMRDVILDPPDETWPLLVSVEVLEHLEDPIAFLKSLRRMLQPGGRAFITAAITAPNADHIYLYNNCDEVIAQLRAAGFELIEYQEDIAYAPRRDEPVPRLGAFIVT